MKNNLVNTMKVFTCLVILLSTLFLPLQRINAGPDSLTFTMKKGGSWTYTTLDMDYVKKNKINLKSANIVQKVEFIPPETVQIMANDLAQKVGISKSKEYIKFGVESAASYGIKIAKDKLVKKFGSSAVSKVIPFLAYFTWSYTAIDIMSSIATGQNLTRLATAAKNKTGLIYVKSTSGGWSSSKWHYWDGTSRYGKYPTVYLNPNKYQYGNVSIKK